MRGARAACLLPALLSAMAGVAIAQPPAAPAAPEVVGEVRIHGNYRTPDAEVISLAGVAIGTPLEENGLEMVASRLRRSGRFEQVEVRKRGRSLSDPADVALIIIVREVPGADPLGNLPGPFARLGSSLMVLPILDYVDGYGITVGGRFSFVGVLGREGMVSIPLTWGGSKRAAIELDKHLSSGPFSRLQATASFGSRRNPFFDMADERGSLSADVSRTFRTIVNLGASAGWTSVKFGATRDSFTAYGAHVSVDTRGNPAFPRNAVYALADWRRLDPKHGTVVNTYAGDVRGYLGLPMTSVLAGRVTISSADGPLPGTRRRCSAARTPFAGSGRARSLATTLFRPLSSCACRPPRRCDSVRAAS